MIGTVAGMSATLAALLAGRTIAENRYNAGTKADEAHDRLRDRMGNSQLQDVSVREVVSDMYFRGIIDQDEYEKSIKRLDSYEKNYGESATWWGNFWERLHRMTGTQNEATKFFNEIYDKLPEYLAYYGDEIPERIKGALYASVPNIADAPAPEYLDTNPNNVIGELWDVDPTHLYTGQEMADLHNLNYDPNSYYDLVKAGTSAALDAARFSSEQMNQAAMIGDARDQASYLDAIRNEQSKAITSGATEGAKAAAELLAMQGRDSDYTQNQTNVANKRLQAVDQFLLQDASAKLTARQQFENLAKSLSTDAATLYLNDADRFGQDWLSNAERYTADQNLLGNRIYANMKMAGDYAQAQAAVNAARSSAAGQADEYAFVFDRFMDKNNGNVPRSVIEFNNYMAGQYTGKPTGYNYLVDNYYQ